MSKNTVVLPDDKSVETAIQTLRKEKGNRFLILGYTATTPSNVLGVMAEGEGGVTEIVAALPDPEDTEKYILLKKDVPVDDSKKISWKVCFHLLHT
jgi:hypothetical protein